LTIQYVPASPRVSWVDTRFFSAFPTEQLTSGPVFTMQYACQVVTLGHDCVYTLLVVESHSTTRADVVGVPLAEVRCQKSQWSPQIPCKIVHLRATTVSTSSSSASCSLAPSSFIQQVIDTRLHLPQHPSSTHDNVCSEFMNLYCDFRASPLLRDRQPKHNKRYLLVESAHPVLYLGGAWRLLRMHISYISLAAILTILVASPTVPALPDGGGRGSNGVSA